VPALAQRTMTTLTAVREIADGLTEHSTPHIAQSMIA
jgi:L-aspartate oxidase